MGTRNRERRRAKQQARLRQRRREPQRPGSQWPGSEWPGGEWPGGQGSAGELPVADLLDRAVHVAHCPDHDDTEYSGCLTALAAHPGRVDRGVLSMLEEAVSECWHRGWQPADVVRIVGRRADARSVRLVTDAIAAEMRGYATATVDGHWAAQLAALPAALWWEHDDRFVEMWAAREGLDRAEAIGVAVSLAGLLGLVPELPRLVPLPGTARLGAPAASRGTAADERMLDRIRALLAKAESTTFPAEAETYTAKAQELMARHSIDQALLAAGAAEPEQPAGRRLGVDNPYEQPKALLLGCVASANRCRAVWSKEMGFSTVMGFPADLDAVELLYTSLLVQATAAMLHEGSRQDRWGRSRTRSFRQSFLTAYATRISQRLEEATRSATAQAAAGRAELLPVLAGREQRVEQAAAELFPGLVMRSVRASDGEGWASGTAAADRASLGVAGRLSR